MEGTTMTKVQYIELLKLRGITELPKGESIQSMIDGTGGAPTKDEMIKTNEAAMFYWLSEKKKLDNETDVLKQTVTHLTERLNFAEKDLDKLNALELGGVDNWDGYDHAMELMNSED
jgi:hypothetical protein